MEVKKHDTVTVDYEGRLENGEIFDSSNHGDHSHPLTFEAGAGQVIPGFDSAVLGMKEGEEKEVTIKPEQAYGQHNPELEQKVPRSALKMDKEPEVGMMLGLNTPDGRQAAVHISAVDKESITVDLNPPLAG
ncbi:MAG: peptidylprolyl isomerase, partial [Nanoarchaeota archaeon]|nr:peptidylprolyl isomerase [Nanoarchaeota archaeon]